MTKIIRSKKLKHLNFPFRFNGRHFAKNLADSIRFKQKRGKKNKRIRYVHYCIWARELLRSEIGPENAHFSYPSCVLDYIRHEAPGNIVGEIRPDAYEVDLKTFCIVMNIPRIEIQ